MKLVEDRGALVGAMVAEEDDEVYAIASDGVVIRTRVSEIRATGRDTMGVSLMNVGDDNAIVAVALGEASDDDEDDADDAVDGGESGPDASGGDDTDASSSPSDAADGDPSVTVVDDPGSDSGVVPGDQD